MYMTHEQVSAMQLPAYVYTFQIVRDEHGDATGYRVESAKIDDYCCKYGASVPSVAVTYADGSTGRAGIWTFIQNYHDAVKAAEAVMGEYAPSRRKLEMQCAELARLLREALPSLADNIRDAAHNFLKENRL